MYTAEEISAIRNRFAEAGIRIYSCHAPFGKHYDLSDTDPDQWQKTIEKHFTAIEHTAAAGGRILIIHPSADVSDKTRIPKKDALYASLELLIPAAQKAGITLALENMLSNQLCDTSSELHEIVTSFNSPVLGACFDVGHFHVTGEGAIQAFNVLHECIIHFHLQDNDSSRDMHVQPPYGTIDWNTLIKSIKRQSYKFPFTVEARPWNKGSWSDLLREVNALFETGILTVPLDGRDVQVLCPKCGRYCFGTLDNWTCGCDQRPAS
jgi:sugar phosphate isomerase/epimerase